MEKFLVLGLLLFSLGANASVISLNQKAGKVTFLATGNPGFLKINGKGEGPEGEINIENNKINGVIKVKIESLKTGISLRDRHMKEKYLHAEKNPYAELKLKDVAVPEGWTLENPVVTDQKTKADLTLNNVTKPVDVIYSIDKNKKLQAKFDLKITDFGIELPTFMKVTVADHVAVNVETKITERKVASK